MSWVQIVVVYLGGLVVLLAFYGLSRSDERRRARYCGEMSSEMLRRADMARREAVLCTSSEQRDVLIAHASLLTRDARYWETRARAWEEGDI